MRLVIQRVTHATVTVQSRSVGEIDQGLLILVGFGLGDTANLPSLPIWNKMLSKIVELRIFPDSEGRMNKSLADTAGELMVVSQFTLYADCKKGRRPSFTRSCPPELAQTLYETLLTDLADLTDLAPGKLASGEFGAEMLLDFTNWGPVTIILDSDEM